MKAFWGSLLSGVSTIIIGWVLPMFYTDLPYVLKVSLLAIGFILLFVSAYLLIANAKKSSDRAIGDISLKMGNNNTINRIGHEAHERREKDR